MERLESRTARCLILTVLWAVIYLGTIAAPALLDDADTVHAEAVREMAQSGDWTTLKINNGIRYLEKAPFMYWLSALSVRVFGLHDWSVRLPVALFALLLTFLIYGFGRRFLGERPGFYAALVFVSSLGPFAFTRLLLPDVMLTFFMALAFYFYIQVVYESEEEIPRRLDPRCMGIYVATALACLTKGLVGMIFVGTIIFIHMVLTRRWDLLRRLQILRGVVVFLLVGAPWHLAAGFANKGFFWFYFVNEHFLRYLGLRYPKDYDTVPLLLFWALHLAWLFPWSGFLWGLKDSFPRSLRPQTKETQVNLFLYVWIGTILAFFSFSTTQEYYTFPTLPAFALLLGQVLARLESPQGAADQRKAAIGMNVMAGASVLLSVLLFALAWMGGGGVSETTDLSNTLTFNPEQYALSFGHMHDLTPATFAHLAPLVYRTAIVLLIAPVAALAASIWKRWSTAALLLAVMMAGLLHSYHSGMVAFEPVLSSRSLAKSIQTQYRPGDLVFVNGVYEKGSSINYYTGIQLSILNGHFGNLWYGSYFADAPRLFYNDEEFLEVWNSGRRVFLFSEETPLNRFLGRHPDLNYEELASAGGKRVLMNPAATPNR
ncbi:MAG: ArnT family glycosyltransferase [Acidobacteriota bacterium]